MVAPVGGIPINRRHVAGRACSIYLGLQGRPSVTAPALADRLVTLVLGHFIPFFAVGVFSIPVDARPKAT